LEKLILAINPGSTSTKIAIYEAIRQSFIKNIKHSTEDLSKFDKISDQFEFRREIILKELKDAKIDINNIAIVMGRGGLVKPIPSGVYNVNERLIEDLKVGILGEHASNLGGLIANDIANQIEGAKAYIVDPVVVDEMDDIARVSGHPLLNRISIFHALNQKAIARTYCQSHNVKYEDVNLIVAHMGGGVSVGAHRNSKVVDVNQALNGDGPFSPERSGSLPVGELAKLCFSGKYTYQEVKQMITGKGGYVAYFGHNDAYKVEQEANAGNEKAKLIQSALAYQVAKEIGAMATVLKGQVDAILLTGGIAYGKPIVNEISQRVGHIAKVFVYPGEDEMKALAMNGLRVLNKQAEILKYV